MLQVPWNQEDDYDVIQKYTTVGQKQDVRMLLKQLDKTDKYVQRMNTKSSNTPPQTEEVTGSIHVSK